MILLMVFAISLFFHLFSVPLAKFALMRFIQFLSSAKRTLFIFIIPLLIVFSCSKEEDSIKTEDTVYPIFPCDHFIRATSCGELSFSTIKSLLKIAGYSDFVKYVKCSIKLYRIYYTTTYQGDTIIVSGLVAYPTDALAPVPTMIVGSGLAFSDEEVPSSFSFPNQYTGFEFIASLGFFTLIPDMIGHGASKQFIFPIHNYEYSARTMIDLIYAGREFVETQNLEISDKNFMAGYSQGGYIVMSALKMIEEETIDDIRIDATAAGAGGFNLVDLLKMALDQNYYPAPAHILLLFTSYNEIYHWNRPLTDFFQEPYASMIPELLSGKYNRSEVDEYLPHSLDRLLNPIFLNNLKNNNETALISALTENSVDDWAPLGPLNIIHSIGDETIPFSNSENTYNKMVANGSISVIFTSCDVVGHVASGAPFVEKALKWFSGFD